MNTLVLSLKSPVSTVLVFLVPIQVLRAAARHRVSGSGLCFLGPGLPGVFGFVSFGFWARACPVFVFRLGLCFGCVWVWLRAFWVRAGLGRSGLG